jgi:hypothetical protein
VEKALREFKPVTYDVSTHVKAIETFETKAVRFLPDPFPTPAPRFRVPHLADPFDPLRPPMCLPRAPALIDCQGEGDRSAD